jgi:hypothetical protein
LFYYLLRIQRIAALIIMSSTPSTGAQAVINVFTNEYRSDGTTPTFERQSGIVGAASSERHRCQSIAKYVSLEN